ncbi:lipid-A-disaccharide synthase [Candidatus Synechococcus calcipolaris G9]|uniref:Lipid-A-disaccharide synthase n=1 Tax=Candidatus Synechococcus calcipolaris G9 TaxID=1497997 RepID=A0ABT6EVH5_9SYNE|nr:lipid-A-disaccharide synthase [Candidatus Synechococcus calcipolaris]MDG2989392.1 lipid-A-disaccharide synthase [Candidatus Synechococcus calcipolaris G9]
MVTHRMEQSLKPQDTAEPLDILILSNGPGELATWVYPVLRAFAPVTIPLRISLVLAPCPHASGQEAAIAQAYGGIDRVQGAEHFWPFLLWGQTKDHWDWSKRGVVLFLGGDQFFAVVLAKRLGYGCVVYAEWEARWLAWVDRVGLRRGDGQPIADRYRHKVEIIGDLMSESGTRDGDPRAAVYAKLGIAADRPLVALMPGSKANKLKIGVPLCVGIGDRLHQGQPDVCCIIPVAPSLTLEHLASYADPDQNSDFKYSGGIDATLVQPETGLPYLLTPQGAKIYLWQDVPNYDLLSCVQICVTTVGANTAELASLAIPMIVLLPAQQLRISRVHSWEGLAGMLVDLPAIGYWWTRLVFWLVVFHGLGWRRSWQFLTSSETNWDLVKEGLGLRAWPNLWAGKEIVPELVGPLEPADVADQIRDYLDHPHRLQEMRHALEEVRGQPGAAQALVNMVMTVGEMAAEDTLP